MRRYVAFLRAINVGGHTVKMDRLRSIFEAGGFAAVETFIASGNVVFEAAGAPSTLEHRIERALATALGYEVATFLRTPAELAEVAAHEPTPRTGWDGPARTLSVAFLKRAPDADAVQRVLAFRSEIDDFDLRGRELYWSCRTKTSDSNFSGARLEKALGAPATIRNVTTVRALAAKYPSHG